MREVLTSTVRGLRTLLRQQTELAKLEAVEAAGVRAAGVGLMVGAGVFAAYALGFLAAAGAAGLAVVLPEWAAKLIVAIVLAGGAAALVFIGRHVLRTAPGVERTRRTLQEDARWVKQQIAR